MVTWLPALICPTSVASTDAWISYEPVLTRWIALDVAVAVSEVDPEPPEEPEEPEEPEDPAAPEDADPDPTCCPTTYPTDVTVPANGAVSVAPARSVAADVT